MSALLKAPEVAKELGISRATLYRNPWLRKKAIRVSEGAVRWDPADIERYKQARKGAGRAA